jgi:hypothetical protein
VDDGAVEGCRQVEETVAVLFVCFYRKRAAG